MNIGLDEECQTSLLEICSQLQGGFSSGHSTMNIKVQLRTTTTFKVQATDARPSNRAHHSRYILLFPLMFVFVHILSFALYLRKQGKHGQHGFWNIFLPRSIFLFLCMSSYPVYPIIQVYFYSISKYILCCLCKCVPVCLCESLSRVGTYVLPLCAFLPCVAVSLLLHWKYTASCICSAWIW